jgi:ubiquinone/menaquinone biosynthesis C-methylase UbiE
MPTPRELKRLYKQGTNVSKVLRELKASQHNDESIIETTYDILTGQYVALMEEELIFNLWNEFNDELGTELKKLGEFHSVMEAGVGEGTTMAGVLDCIGTDLDLYASDISWSRVAYARSWLKRMGHRDVVNLHSATMFNIPLPSCSVDVVYTAHSIEPNGGNEKPILEELYRVAKNYLVLVEPAFDLARAEARQRMVEHGYCVSLIEQVNLLKMDVVEHKLMEVQKNKMNPAAITIIEKKSNVLTELQYVCPKYKTELYHIGDMFYSPEALSVYPIIDGIPCLKPSDAIIASKYPEVMVDDNGLHTV